MTRIFVYNLKNANTFYELQYIVPQFKMLASQLFKCHHEFVSHRNRNEFIFLHHL